MPGVARVTAYSPMNAWVASSVTTAVTVAVASTRPVPTMTFAVRNTPRRGAGGSEGGAGGGGCSPGGGRTAEGGGGAGAEGGPSKGRGAGEEGEVAEVDPVEGRDAGVVPACVQPGLPDADRRGDAGADGDHDEDVPGERHAGRPQRGGLDPLGAESGGQGHGRATPSRA